MFDFSQRAYTSFTKTLADGTTSKEPIPAEECTPEAFDKITSSPDVASRCAAIARLQQQKAAGELSEKDFETQKRALKKNLPVFLFHAHFPDHYRHNDSAVLSGLVMFDIDHIPDPLGRWKEIEPRRQELGIVLAHVSPSCEGLHLVFILPRGMSILQAQQWMAGELHEKNLDTGCKDPARASYAVPASYILFVDRALLFLPRKVEAPKAPQRQAELPCHSVAAKDATAVDPTPSEESLKVFDEAVAASGLTIGIINTMGRRHTSLKIMLQEGLTDLLPQDELAKVIAVRMPEFASEPDCRQLIADWYTKYYNNGMTAKYKAIFKNHLNDFRRLGADDEADGMDEAEKCPDVDLAILPRSLAATLEPIPANLRMPVLSAVMPLAAAYADQVEVSYIDGQRQKLNLMSVIVGPQACGKSACTKMIDVWIEPLKKADEKARSVEEQWKERLRLRKANEKLPEEPKMTVRVVPVTVSCSTLLKRLKNSHGHCLFSYGEELDTLVKSNGAGSWSEKYDIYRLGFDNGSWGQDYNSEMAESGVVRVAYNLTLLGTYGALRRCFNDRNIENGLSSRFLVAEMPDMLFASVPKYGDLGGGARKCIEEGIARLCSASGFIDTPRLREAMAGWVEKKRLEALAGDDVVTDTFRKRAAVIGFRCGVVAMLLEGKETENACRFAQVMADYALGGQCRLFGPAIEKSYADAAPQVSRREKTVRLFDSLGFVFTFNDVSRNSSGSSYGALRTLIYRWQQAGWIRRVEKNTWKKTDEKG